MENTTNPQATPAIPVERGQEQVQKKPALSETEIYFNNLLKSQEENLQSSSRRTKIVPLIILILVIGIGLYFAVNFYVNANNLESSSTIPSEVAKSSGAYFDPSYYANRSRNISGKINKSYNQTDDTTMNFELLGNDGKNIAYLYSKNNDLSLSVGLNVEIQGNLRNTAPDGKDIIEVESIKLK